ncbi:MAG TPA: hypothetical protein VHC97_22770 [Thermoanaerobaculia bacterium]|jgi:hypothetical protein|nr:hypothetical protein [Thermoanaerobaculia bacterium]
MARIEFQVKISGPRPDEVSAHNLAEIISSLEDSIVSFVNTHGLEFPETGPALSLVNVAEGSDLLTFSVFEPVAPAVAVISTAVAKNFYQHLPSDTHDAIYRVSETVRKAGWGLEFIENERAGIEAAVITPEHGVTRPSPPPTLSGTTTLLARCLRVGGATTPKAELRVVQGGRLINPEISEELAKQLGHRLYEEVVVEGVGRWDTRTWDLLDFTIKRIYEFDRIDPKLAIRELAEAAGDNWDEADAAEFVYEHRRDD